MELNTFEGRIHEIMEKTRMSYEEAADFLNKQINQALERQHSNPDQQYCCYEEFLLEEFGLVLDTVPAYPEHQDIDDDLPF